MCCCRGCARASSVSISSSASAVAAELTNVYTGEGESFIAPTSHSCFCFCLSFSLCFYKLETAALELCDSRCEGSAGDRFVFRNASVLIEDALSRTFGSTSQLSAFDAVPNCSFVIRCTKACVKCWTERQIWKEGLTGGGGVGW